MTLFLLISEKSIEANCTYKFELLQSILIRVFAIFGSTDHLASSLCGDIIRTKVVGNCIITVKNL